MRSICIQNDVEVNIFKKKAYETLFVAVDKQHLEAKPTKEWVQERMKLCMQKYPEEDAVYRIRVTEAVEIIYESEGGSL